MEKSPLDTKTCEACGRDRLLGDFYPHKNGGRSALCRTCTVADNKLRRQNPEGHRLALEARRIRRAEAKTQASASVVEKVCCKCGDVKLLSGFRVHRGLHGRSSWCLECERQYTRDWTEENRDEYNAKRRAVWAVTEFTVEQRSSAAARARSWYAGNKDRVQATTRAWLEANRDAYNVIQARRRARKAAVLNTLLFEEWEQILDTFNHACAYCLRTDLPLTMDHMIPISKGGPHTAGNVIPPCRPCNSPKGNRPIFVLLNRKSA